MNFFKQTASLSLYGSEQFIRDIDGIVICETNSNKETNFSNGTLILTSHRLFWRDLAGLAILSLDLKSIKSVAPDSQRTSEGYPRLCITFFEDSNVLKLVFTHYGSQLFLNFFNDTLQRRRWDFPDSTSTSRDASSSNLSSLGISAVQRKIEAEKKTTDATLKAAFGDIDKLMNSAQEMVNLSRKLAEKIREGQGAISADETVEFKSVLLSMGIANPVTRQTTGNETKYHRELSKQLSSFLTPILKAESGSTMSLSDVYCRFNRARGVDLVSPDDILLACEQFDKLGLPLVLRRFESGVIVVQPRDLNDDKMIEETMSYLEQQKQPCITAEELSRHLKMSISLSKERLLMCEQKGKLCRDDNVEGLKFYPNKFLTCA